VTKHQQEPLEIIDAEPEVAAEIAFGAIAVAVAMLFLLSWIANEVAHSATLRFDNAIREYVHTFASPAVTLLTATHGEPFYVHLIPVARRRHTVAVTVRWLGTEIEAFRVRHGLSRREAQVAELVLHGYRNADIAGTLGISAGTTKKHLTRIFDKVGIDSRSQLIARLA